MLHDDLLELYEKLEAFRQRRYQLLVGWIVYLFAAVILPLSMIRLLRVFGIAAAAALLAAGLMLLLASTIKNENYGYDLNKTIEKAEWKRKIDDLEDVKVGTDGEMVQPESDHTWNGKNS